MINEPAMGRLRARVRSVKGRGIGWQAAVAGALASALLASAAAADSRIFNDRGGEIVSYLSKYQGMRASGERLVIDGPCLSACTLFTAIIPREQVCVTRRAVLGFHAASYYNTARRSLIPTRAGTHLVMRIYPTEIRRWIERRGGLHPWMIMMRGRDLAALYATCP